MRQPISSPTPDMQRLAWYIGRTRRCRDIGEHDSGEPAAAPMPAPAKIQLSIEPHASVLLILQAGFRRLLFKIATASVAGHRGTPRAVSDAWVDREAATVRYEYGNFTFYRGRRLPSSDRSVRTIRVRSGLIEGRPRCPS